MGMSVISGAAENIQNTSTGLTRTTFRIDNRQVSFTSQATPNLSDGENVTVAGREKNGEFIAYVIKNNTTNIICESLPARVMLIFGAIMFLISVPFIFVLVGIFPAALGLTAIYFSLRIKKAVALVTE